MTNRTKLTITRYELHETGIYRLIRDLIPASVRIGKQKVLSISQKHSFNQIT